MRVAVKNMSGVFIHSTTPRKARLLLKEKKAVIESNNPFTIRLLFSESECGLKDSKPKTQGNTVSVLSETSINIKTTKDSTMCTENNIPKIITTVSNKNFPDDHILYLDRSNSSTFMSYYGVIPSSCQLFVNYTGDCPVVVHLDSRNNLSFLRYGSIK